MFIQVILYLFFFFNATATTEIYTLSLHDALPIWHFPDGQEADDARSAGRDGRGDHGDPVAHGDGCLAYLARSEEHTSELQSQFHLVCRLLLEKKKKYKSKLYKEIKKLTRT